MIKLWVLYITLNVGCWNIMEQASRLTGNKPVNVSQNEDSIKLTQGRTTVDIDRVTIRTSSAAYVAPIHRNCWDVKSTEVDLGKEKGDEDKVQ